MRARVSHIHLVLCVCVCCLNLFIHISYAYNFANVLQYLCTISALADLMHNTSDIIRMTSIYALDYLKRATLRMNDFLLVLAHLYTIWIVNITHGRRTHTCNILAFMRVRMLIVFATSGNYHIVNGGRALC